jgi:hypothetical protein
MNMDTTTNKVDQSEHRNKVSRDEVAQRAYQLWVAAGQPSGRDLEYWLQAEAELCAAWQSGRSPEVGGSEASPKRETTPPPASSAPGPEAKKSQDGNARAPLDAVVRQARRR